MIAHQHAWCSGIYSKSMQRYLGWLSAHQALPGGRRDIIVAGLQQSLQRGDVLLRRCLSQHSSARPSCDVGTQAFARTACAHLPQLQEIIHAQRGNLFTSQVQRLAFADGEGQHAAQPQCLLYRALRLVIN